MPDAPAGLELFAEKTASAALEDLRARLRATRWPDTPADAGWSLGADVAYLRELVAYWAQDFDWLAQEAALTRLPRFRVALGGLGLHFVYVRAVAPVGRILPILTNVTIYWLTRTIGSSMRMYHANAAIEPAQLARRVGVPSGFSLFPGDIVRPPRAWFERTANVVRVSEPARGGHFAPFEEPEIYAQELREFFRPYRAATTD